ncbi:energy-coupling factor ABC transporter substrate-binding protein [Phycicoccus endophyticus]|uniref:Cobalt transport protein CbiN n=1 Tax=Phycicoccus endophyticus TaxID=1690220 RepID=A0A7G9R3M6_9MICO|nr:energy-coupling factor ABC transporter substrate-binding protein [Phycicoccus endophyticus]NHI18014.1 energy-coupling factor ABC transporter substrate-binding protein [Phycicoccus endophyticus]QNN50201.1 energy-coupling factor ABC transporter substrate-binding protein [Phycicoccus endophyticus]GGL27096.1 cobalt transport protein CbiN [Phycicoccus endophyticus]
MRERRTTILLLAVAVLVVVGCLLVAGNGDYGGTDGAATDAITASDPSYRPWFSHLWAPNSSEVESGLFALQAALGAGFVGFVLGTLRERWRARTARAEAGR